MTLLPVRALLISAMCGMALLGQARGFEILSAQQTSPGNIVVTLNDNGPDAPKASELSLQLDDAPTIRPSSITNSPGSNSPHWLLLCLDRSGSIGPAALADLKTALTHSLVRGGTADLPFKVALVAFDTRSTHLLGFTNQRAQVAAAIDRIGPTPERGGKTRLYDAIAGGLAELRAEAEGNKRLIVVSDGKDEGSTLSAARLGQLAQTAPSIPVDGISFGAMAAANSGSLSSIAGETGGRFIQAGNPAELDQGLQRLISSVAPGPAVTVAFVYTPAADKRTSESASLIYAVEGRAPARQALNIAAAAPMAATADSGTTPATPRASPSPSPTPGGDSGKTSSLLNVSLGGFSLGGISLFKDVPPIFIWLAGALLIVALVLLALRLRSRDDAEEEKPAPDNAIGLAIIQRSTTSVPPPPPPPAPPARSKNTMVGYAWPAPRPTHPTAILRGVSGSSRGELFPVDKAAFRIGCSPDNDLVLIGDDFASGYHALMRYEAGALYVEDLGSTNGSYLNGTSFKSATRSLSPGDELRFGHTTFELSVAGAHAHTSRSNLEPRVK